MPTSPKSGLRSSSSPLQSSVPISVLKPPSRAPSQLARFSKPSATPQIVPHLDSASTQNQRHKSNSPTGRALSAPLRDDLSGESSHSSSPKSRSRSPLARSGSPLGEDMFRRSSTSSGDGKKGSRKVTFGSSAPPPKDSPAVDVLPDELRACAVLKGLTKEQAQQLASQAEPLSMIAGQTMMQENETPEAMYLVRSGFLQVYCAGRVVANKRRGELVGEVAAYGTLWSSNPAMNGSPVSCVIPSKRTATVIASTQCEVVGFPIEVLKDLVTTNKALQQALQDEAVKITLLAALKGSETAKAATAMTPRHRPPDPTQKIAARSYQRPSSQSQNRLPTVIDSGLQDLVVEQNGTAFLMSESSGHASGAKNPNLLDGMFSLFSAVASLAGGEESNELGKVDRALQVADALDEKTRLSDLAGQDVAAQKRRTRSSPSSGIEFAVL